MNITHPQVGPYGPPRAVWPAGLTHLEHTMPTQHTPEPWTLDKKFGVPVIGIDVHDGGPLLPIVDVVHGKNKAEARKNARLIAAAPKMAAALGYIVRRLQMDIEDGSRPDQWTMEDLIRTARAALPSDNSHDVATGAAP